MREVIWVDGRAGSRRAGVLDAVLRRELASAVDGAALAQRLPVGRTAAILVLSVPVHLATPAAFAAAVWALRDGAPPASYLLAAFLVLAGLGSWPGRPSPGEPAATYRAGDAPATFRILNRVCRHVGAPRLTRFQLTSGATTTVFRARWTRRRGLSVGALLWVSLSDQARVALIAHEAAHLVRPELRLASLTRRAEITLEEWRMITGGQRSRRAGDGTDVTRFLTAVTAVLLAPLRWGAIAWSRLLGRLQAPVTARGERLADRTAAEAAGAGALEEVWDVTISGATWETALSRGLSGRQDLAATLRSAVMAVPAQRRADRRRASAEAGGRIDVEHPATELRRGLRGHPAARVGRHGAGGVRDAGE